MKVKPYEKYSIRSRRRWKEAADKLGIHTVILREIYWQVWFRGVEASYVLDQIISGEWDLQKVLNDEQMPVMTPEEIAEKDEKQLKAAEDEDFTDLMYYRLKKLIQVGDYVMCDESKTFLSGGEYVTAGKKYRIKELSDDRDGLTGFTAITTTNMRKEQHWLSHLGVNSLWRGRKEIWNWSTAYFDLYLEQNPDFPKTKPEEFKEFEEYNRVAAEKHRKGLKE
jgi:hypothetical protein